MNAVRKFDLHAPLRSALIVTANEGHARVDRLSLKNARVVMARAVPSGRTAREQLLKTGADVVLVDDTLEDGSGWDFMRSLKADERLRHIPVILVSTTGVRERVIEAIQLGCVGFLVRPYTLGTFFNHLSLASQAKSFLRQELTDVSTYLDMAEKGQAQAALPKLQKTLETPDEAQYHYENGLRHLAKEEYTRAVQSFTQAARISALMAEAHLGLARCWLALGDEVRYRNAMTKAASISAKAKRFEHYKEEFLSILKADPHRFNPFVALGMRLARGMDWEGALMALKNAVWLSPEDSKAYVELAKAYHFKREPELARKCVSKALMLSQHDPEAQALYDRWTGLSRNEKERIVEKTPGRAKRQKRLLPDMIPTMLNGVLYLAGVVTEGIHRFRRDYA